MKTFTNMIKIQKILAQRGVASRRKSEKLIEEGRVFVNGQQAHIAMRAAQDAKIVIDGKPIDFCDEPTRLLMLNKPEGYECSRKPIDGVQSVFKLLPRINKGRWIVVGRLDINTSGLLLFTNNGDLAHKLMHPSSHIQRGYLVRCRGVLDDGVRKKALEEGVDLEGKRVKFLSLSRLVSNESKAQNHWYTCSLNVGYYHVVRRTFSELGLEVNRLKRFSFGPLSLPKNLRLGKFTDVDPKAFEVN